jgi:CHAT domain-containing protein
MKTTPGAADLNGVIQEVEAIEKALNGWEMTKLAQPSAAAVLQNLADVDMVHFACHGRTDSIYPSRSYLALERESGQDALTELDKLCIEQISNLDLQSARMVYLSACSTAKNEVAILADEAIHLSSAFLVAGFSHVIGSLWSTKDTVCVEMASKFYDHLARNGIHGMEDNNHGVALAFWHATDAIQTKYRGRPLLWAPFIHFGA